MRRTLRCALLTVVLAVGASAASAEGVGLYLWELGEKTPFDPELLTDGPVAVRLEVGNVQGVEALLEKYATLEVIAADTESVTVISRSTDSVREWSGNEFSAASFIIDYDEPAIRVLLDELDGESTAAPTPEMLQNFVYQHISNKTYSRGYDIASKVAKTGSGDCTEHAFLLTALARAEGYPARAVFGILILAMDGQVQSFGHAWTEIFVGQRWRRYDATLPEGQEIGEWLRYVPFMPVVNEGPGYMLGVMEIASLWPRDVRLVPESAIRADRRHGDHPH